MLQEYNIVIADTSCFILLDKINELELLKKIFSKITTTPEIAKEFGKTLPEWIEIKAVRNNTSIEVLEAEVDEGEASAIALALETKNALVILDDFKARQLAEKLKLHYTGTLGIILKAKEIGILSAISPIMKKVQATNFRLSEKVLKEILREADE
jgi:predicted nucleic acid-binding protein